LRTLVRGVCTFGGENGFNTGRCNPVGGFGVLLTFGVGSRFGENGLKTGFLNPLGFGGLFSLSIFYPILNRQKYSKNLRKNKNC